MCWQFCNLYARVHPRLQFWNLIKTDIAAQNHTLTGGRLSSYEWTLIVVDQHGDPYFVKGGLVKEAVVRASNHNGDLPDPPGYSTGSSSPGNSEWHLPKFIDPIGSLPGGAPLEKQHWIIEVPNPQDPTKRIPIKLLDPRPHILVPMPNGSLDRQLPKNY